MWLRIWSSALLGFSLLAYAEEHFVYEVTYSGIGKEEKVRHESIYDESDGKKVLVLERVYKAETNALVLSQFRPPGGDMTNYNDGVPNQREIVEGYISKASAPKALAGDPNKIDPKYIDASPKSPLPRVFLAVGAGLLALLGFRFIFRRV